MPKSTVMVYTEDATAPGAGGAAQHDSGTAPAGVLRLAAATIAGFFRSNLSDHAGYDHDREQYHLNPV